MRRIQKLFFPLLLLCSLILTSGFVAARGQVQFSWAVLTDTPEGQHALDASIPISLASGTTLQIYIEQQPGAYIYIYLLDSDGNLHFLFPEKTDYYSSFPPVKKTFRIPAEPDRFELVPPGGQEKLYLMAAPSRLKDLEELTAKYLDQPLNPERKATVVQEMKKTRRLHSKLARTTETSVPVAGTVRTRGTQVNTFDVTKVDAMDFYSKILRINHE